MYALLARVALVVGALIGTVGVGGILLIPALRAFAGLSTHGAKGTALFNFLFTGLLGTCLYRHRGCYSILTLRLYTWNCENI